MSDTVRALLAGELARGRAVFVVGSGVTIAATGNPALSWLGLVRSGIRRVVDINPALSGPWEEKQVALAEGGDLRDLLSVAHDVKGELTELPGAQYANWLAETVGVVRVRRDAALPQLLGSFAVPIATTNYDDVLSVATGRTPVTWDNPRLWQAEFRDPGRHVMHLHGHWQHPDTVIFGYRDYARVVGDGISQELVRSFSILSQIIVVGMGEGLRDPNFQGLGNWLAAIAPDNDRPPVVLVRDSELESAQRHGTQIGLLAASYGADYEDLELYLSDLLSATRQTRSPDPVALDWTVLSNKLRRLAVDFRTFGCGSVGPSNAPVST